MIEFLNNSVRALFHELPLEKQKEWYEVAEGFSARGHTLKVLFVENTPQGLEVSIRIDQKLDVPR